MIFSKSDKLYERLATNRVERVAHLKKLKRKRSLVVWGALLVLVANFVLIFTLPLEGLRWLEEILKFLLPIFLGLFVGFLLLNQDIKMLLLVEGIDSGKDEPEVEGGDEGSA